MDPPLPPPSNDATTVPTPTPSTTLFPKLEILPRDAPRTFTPPTKRINEGPDVAHFLTSQAYRDIGIFVLQLNRAVLPRQQPVPIPPGPSPTPPPPRSNHPVVRTFPLNAPRQDPEVVRNLQELLKQVEKIIDDAPLDPGPRRFGNVGFRTWHVVLQERAGKLLREYLPRGVVEGDDAAAMEEVTAYFLGGFGSAQRLDYGTGHELSFLAFLGCLWKLGAFQGSAEGDAHEGGDVPGAVERSIVLGVIEPYLRVIRRLILHYNLEPAGSHGVWGLDDHSFLPYIFGSAQLARPLTSETEPTPTEGSAPRTPRPSDVAKPEAAESNRETWMYFSAVAFINDVKKGPFWEHSPILFDVSGIRDGWGKINKGMIKMFNAEVLSKFPVVQHFPFGSLFSWETDPNAQAPVQSVHLANQPTSAPVPAGPPGAAAGTAAPWAQATRMPGATAVPGPGIPYSKAPWVGTGSAGPSMPRGGVPDTGPPPPSSFPRGVPGTASNQHAVTKAPWAK